MLPRFTADEPAHDACRFAAAAVFNAGQRAVGLGPDQQVGIHRRDAGTARQQVRVVAREKHDGVAADIQRIFTAHRGTARWLLCEAKACTNGLAQQRRVVECSR